jgi:hypothetical protein
MATPSIVALIDDFLAAPKTLEGAATWRDMGHHGQHRLVFPIHVGGVSSGFDLEICAYPNRSPLRFTISIRQPICIWRLDYSETDVHPNSLNAPPDISGETIMGVHYHAWADNRRFVTTNQLPKNMKNARKLPESINGFEAAFAWFRRETNIAAPPSGAVELPARTELF